MQTTRELIVDLFAGGGGASTGIEQALGLPVDIAVNHDPEAIRMHWLNHPKTTHLTEDVWKVDPVAVTRGRPVGLLWASPDCTHHSRAKGGKPRSGKRRSLADVVIEWARQPNRPRVIMLENVVEFEDWGPLNEAGMPIKTKKGQDFKRWVEALRKQGYVVEWRRLIASDYGVPTSRERFFLIARCDGEPIVWPEPTHGPGLLPYRTAAECIDWSIPCPSIFLTKEECRKQGLKCVRPLAENTMRRIAAGLKKFVIDNPDPYVLPLDADNATAPFISKYFTGVVGSSIDQPLPTVTAIDHNALVMPFLTKYHGGCRGEDRGQVLTEPLLTQDTQNRFGLVKVYAYLIKYYGCGVGQSIAEPMHTITSKDRLGLVTVAGQSYRITDIGMRMLAPEELLKAHGFPLRYVSVGTKTTMVAKIGNSVPPKMPKVLVKANVKIREIEQVKAG